MLANTQWHRGNRGTQTHTLELIKLTRAYFTQLRKNPTNYRSVTGAETLPAL